MQKFGLDMSSSKIRCLIFVAFASAILLIVVPDSANGSSDDISPEESCKFLKPTAVDERWLSSVGTWYVIYMGKIEGPTGSSEEEGRSKKKTSTPERAEGGAKKAPKKFCYTLEFDPGVFGHGEKVPLNYTCTYYNGDVASQLCQLKQVDGVSLDRGAPKKIKYYAGLVAQEQSKVYVMTDNKTYVAEVSCLPYGGRTFAMYSVKPVDPGKAVRSGVQKRLGGMGMDLEHVSDSVNKRPVRITTCNGPSTPGAPAKKSSKATKTTKKG